MAQNTIPTKLSELFSFADQIADGLGLLGVALGMVHNSEALVRADLLAAETAYDLFNQARAAKLGLTAAQGTADANGRTYLATARNVIASFLGSEWTQVWEPTGFPNQSTAIPSTIAERQTLLNSLKLYFTANPTQEVAAHRQRSHAARPAHWCDGQGAHHCRERRGPVSTQRCLADRRRVTR